MKELLYIRLQKKSLEAELEARRQDYEDVARKYRRETNPAERNSLEAQLEELGEDINRIEKELEDLNKQSQNFSIEEVIKNIEPYYDQEKYQIKKAYRLSLPKYLIDPESPASLKELINSLQLPRQEENYTCIEKFIGHLFLNPKINCKLKQDLSRWIENNIEECNKLLEQLKREQQQEEEYVPGLFIVIQELEGSYSVEAWLNYNVKKSSSNYKRLKFNNQDNTIQTDEALKNIPALLKDLISQSLEECSKDLEQIHIFLPAKLMNHAVDWWESWQEDEDEDYMTTIGEDYEVLLRCSERLKGNTPARVRWYQKREILKSKLAQPAEEIFILGDSVNCRSLQKKVTQDQQAIAIKITTVFQGKEPGTLLWRKAVPLALWIRQQLPQINNQTVLDELLKDSYLQSLPNQVKSKRVEAMDCEPPENHIGRHLCLLWDDPNIIPPEQALTENKL
ncbi:hypothetical protein VB834_16875 [Limnoraphis robusta Tam1]|uniref:VMAP-C domain-containing protein n=1 Tax=Limnoraphis robusta TaxID=1118279 RepID=UPI002B201718|nr:hypothetical protein [Limnoraphis robusta]MEA5499182.1 hypothetical protein [Limnoraphis robusta BA-68 BA1]MEA5540697.1 hypothetical protein [Limnoraphis robusta Tam1]